MTNQQYRSPGSVWGRDRLGISAAVVGGNKHSNAANFGELLSEGTFFRPTRVNSHRNRRSICSRRTSSALG